MVGAPCGCSHEGRPKIQAVVLLFRPQACCSHLKNVNIHVYESVSRTQGCPCCGSQCRLVASAIVAGSPLPSSASPALMLRSRQATQGLDKTVPDILGSG